MQKCSGGVQSLNSLARSFLNSPLNSQRLFRRGGLLSTDKLPHDKNSKHVCKVCSNMGSYTGLFYSHGMRMMSRSLVVINPAEHCLCGNILFLATFLGAWPVKIKRKGWVFWGGEWQAFCRRLACTSTHITKLTICAILCPTGWTFWRRKKARGWSTSMVSARQTHVWSPLAWEKTKTQTISQNIACVWA